MDLSAIQGRVYRIQRDHFPDNPNRDQKLLLIVGELIEAQNELRNRHTPTEVYYSDSEASSHPKPEGYPIELADALIRILNLMSDEGLYAEELIELKSAYNADRPYKHGKAF